MADQEVAAGRTSENAAPGCSVLDGENILQAHGLECSSDRRCGEFAGGRFGLIDARSAAIG